MKSTVDDENTTPLHTVPVGTVAEMEDEGGAGKCCEPTRRKFSRLLGIRAFVVVVCFYVVASFTVEMYFFAVLTTIEKRFGFRSSSTGVILTGKEIAYVLSVTPFSHFANKWHRPRFLSILAILGALCSFICALPHFLYDSPFELVQPNSSHTSSNNGAGRYLCLSQSEGVTPGSVSILGNITKTDQCESSAQTAAQNNGAYTIFMVSYVVFGCTISPMIALTTTYVDDAVGPVKNAIYLAFMNMMRPLGPVLSYLLGALFTSYHESLEDPGYDATDRRWVGAWWIGYLTNPSLLVLAAIFIAVFPSSMPRDVELDEKAIELKQEKISKKNEDEPNAVVDMFKGIGRLLCNPAYMMLILGGCFSAFVASGMLPFIPKYLEVQFHLTASMANVLTGIVGALLGGVGAFAGGMLISCLKWKPSQSAFFIFITDILFVTAILIMMTVTCSNPPFVGTPDLPANGTCSTSCGCSVNDFNPVCGADGMTYMSPCLAGCETLYGNQTYGDCGCLNGGMTASPGSCDSGCQMWIAYMSVLGAGLVIGMMASVPGTTICLIVVEERDRCLALGLTGTIISCVGFMPGPAMFGLLIDSTCLSWQESCGNTGHCQLYDNDQIRYKLHGVSAVLKAVAGIFYFLLWLAVRREEKKLTVLATASENEQGDSMLKSSESPL